MKVKTDFSCIGLVFVWLGCTGGGTIGEGGCTLTWSIVGWGSYGRDGRSTRGRVRSLSVPLYRGGRADKMILGIAVLERRSEANGKDKKEENKMKRGEEKTWEHVRNKSSETFLNSATLLTFSGVNTARAHAAMQALPFCRGCGGLCTATYCSGLEMRPLPL